MGLFLERTVTWRGRCWPRGGSRLPVTCPPDTAPSHPKVDLGIVGAGGSAGQRGDASPLV